MLKPEVKLVAAPEEIYAIKEPRHRAPARDFTAAAVVQQDA